MHCLVRSSGRRWVSVAFLMILSVVAVPSASAQEEEEEGDAPDSELPATPWNTNLIGRLSATQAAYSNWQEGGLNNLALTATVDGRARREEEAWIQEYKSRLVYGVVKQDTLSFRKADDVINLSASFQNKGKGFFKTFKPTVATTLRTQFAPGYNYDKNPFEGRTNTPVKVSAFFAPAVFTESIGLTYSPEEGITQRFGIAGKQTAVHIRRFRPLYGLDPEEWTRFELGVDSYTEFDREVFENVQVTSTLGLFAAFNKANVPDMLWESSVAMEVNTWLGVNLDFVALYDRDISRRIQFKEVFSLGISISMI